MMCRHAPRKLGARFAILVLVILLCAVGGAPAHAGGPGPNVGSCPPPGPQGCGDPVILYGSGFANVYEALTDYTTVGQNPLALTRFYNSRSGAPGGSFGIWRSNFDRSLSISQTEVDASRADGKVIFFFPDGSGGWTGLSDLDVQIAQSGSNWVLTDWNDTVETYSNTGLLLSIRMRNGYTQTLSYIQSAGCGGRIC
jgi:hypothetical protein